MPRKATGYKRYNFYLDPRDVAHLEEAAAARGYSTSEMLRYILAALRKREEKKASLEVIEGGQ